jgi:nucleotide-binding universal stress UspA family protein
VSAAAEPVAHTRARPERGESGPFTRILLASEGRPFTDAAIARVIDLARPNGASVRVFSIARVHGVAFGLPNPGLLPTKKEWEEQRRIVGRAVKRLERKGIDADGHVVGTRTSTKRILQEAELAGCDAIVMAADPDRNRLSGDFMWSQEPQRVRRRAKLPVFLVLEDEGSGR